MSNVVPITPKAMPLTGELSDREPVRPPRFDPYRIAATPAMRELVEELTNGFLRAEAHFKVRKRARKPADLRTCRAIIEALICDLAYQHSIGHKSLRVTRNRADLARKTRYASEILSEQLPAILDFMQRQMGMIEQRLGSHSPFGGRQTEIAASPWLMSKFNSRALTIYDIDRREGEELILLKGTKVAQARADLAEYTDDEFTNLYRAEVRQINRYLRAADISYNLDLSSTGLLVDERNRYLRRIFTRESFGSGGRLFGGFWQSLGKEERLANTTINGEPVVSLDYKAMLATLAYARVQAVPPSGDAYVTEYMSESGERVSVPRGTIKKIFAACLFATGELTHWPRGLQSRAGGLSVSTVIEGIKKAHPALVPMFFQGLGHALQFAESEILVDVLLRLIERGIPALPVHDCVVVAESAQETATLIMRAVAEFHLPRVPWEIRLERAD